MYQTIKRPQTTFFASREKKVGDKIKLRKQASTCVPETDQGGGDSLTGLWDRRKSAGSYEK